MWWIHAVLWSHEHVCACKLQLTMRWVRYLLIILRECAPELHRVVRFSVLPPWYCCCCSLWFVEHIVIPCRQCHFSNPCLWFVSFCYSPFDCYRLRDWKMSLFANWRFTIMHAWALMMPSESSMWHLTCSLTSIQSVRGLSGWCPIAALTSPVPVSHLSSRVAMFSVRMCRSMLTYCKHGWFWLACLFVMAASHRMRCIVTFLYFALARQAAVFLYDLFCGWCVCHFMVPLW